MLAAGVGTQTCLPWSMDGWMDVLHRARKAKHKSQSTARGNGRRHEPRCIHIPLHNVGLCSRWQVLVEISLIGWKEYELEVMRDLNDNVVIICSIENVDPMGVHTGGWVGGGWDFMGVVFPCHTVPPDVPPGVMLMLYALIAMTHMLYCVAGDSITVAPAQTLTDKEYQRLRDAAVAIIREMGVECGGSNVQMAINPEDGDMIIIEMNPRVSRSSALASKATGFPIAKMAAKLAVGYTLDQVCVCVFWGGGG